MCTRILVPLDGSPRAERAFPVATRLARNAGGKAISLRVRYIIYSFSKTSAMTGWRLGYPVASRQLIKTIVNVLNAKYTNVSSIQQHAGAAALNGPQECVTEMREAYRLRRNLAINLLKDFGRYSYTSHGTFYLLINKKTKRKNAPFYAPDLNPDEGIWNYLQRVELGNVCCPDPRSPHYCAHTSQRALASQA